MKYAEEVIELMECYPGREFRMAQIVRHISKGKTVPLAKRHAIREGVKRVLAQLCATGQVEQIKEAETSAFYVWRCSLQYEVVANCNANCNNRPV